jgi:N-acyl homoserine lactone hydrolase
MDTTNASERRRDAHLRQAPPPVHVFQTGRLTGNLSFLRAEQWSALLRKPQPFEFPAYTYVIEHADGLIAIDAGMNARTSVPRWQRRVAPVPVTTPEEEIGPQMRARGLDPDDVRRVIVTHLDWDHVGGVEHFPNAEVLVHRPEYEFASTLLGKVRYQPRGWPARFAPTLYDLDPDPYGPFPSSRVIGERGDLRVVPIPGHSVGQVGVVLETGDATLFFVADHILRQEWFVEDYAAGRLIGLGIHFADRAVETSRRIHRLAAQQPTVLLPAHDPDAPERLARLAPLQVR